ncbi:hypothetical protein MMC18_004622 [Xylographa bjoerkii]|nr:hypothetical protein [Xylographa bjoerkii]
MILSKPIAHVALTCLSVLSLVHGVALTNDNYYGITIGSPFELTWSGDDTPVNITLVDGSPANVIPVAAVAINAPSPSFLWTPSATIPVGEYALAIIQSGSTNYAGPFFIYAANTAAVSTSSTTNLIVPTISPASPASASSASTSATSTIAGFGVSNSSFTGTGTGTGTGMGAPYPTGGMNGTWMGNATVGVGVLTATEDCGCVVETGGVDAGGGGGGASTAVGSAANSGAPFEGGAGTVRGAARTACLIGAVLVMRGLEGLVGGMWKGNQDFSL